MSADPIRFDGPLLLSSPRFRHHPWGGDWLPRLKGLSPSKKSVGESWEFSLHPEFQTKAILPSGEEISLGELALGGNKTPLFLVKWIDARKNLSVQVHPPAPSGKAEAWWVADVDPGEDPAVYIGFSKMKESGLPSVFLEALTLFQKNREPSIEGVSPQEAAAVLSFLNRIPVRPGDAFLVPPGTIHALGAGVRLLEIQQTSDVTFRLWDWNRLGLDGKPRPLHLREGEKALNAKGSDPKEFQLQPVEEENGWSRILCHPEWGLGLRRKVLKANENAVIIPASKPFSVLTVFRGPVRLEGDFPGSPMEAPSGRSVFIPGGQKSISLGALNNPAEVFQSFIP